ncbi:Sulfite reductase [uncultured Defluviicoccus sp.]|uniref:Sulfite reductase n=1 Tax=metagenome TaxID=256318 RepID=A0A380TG70_9ZZZZ|nr:Sulfite reductase [uncultured Defluviicoccus sp.]
MLAPLLPDNAPFTPEQRAWLNGFFAGLLSFDGPADLVTAATTQSVATPAAAADPLADGDDGAAPWHDQTIPMAERMTLAAGRPLRRRMMAAMAQQDCGQCGYNCEDYANALFLKKEERLNLCVPGGKPTARMLKSLHAEMAADAPAAPAATPPANGTAAAAKPTAVAPGRSREKPVLATFLGTRVLNKAGSEKETCHVEFDLAETGLDYQPGDSFGIVPRNDPELADAIIEHLGCAADAEIGDGNGHSRSLRDALIETLALWPAPDALFELLATLSSEAGERAKLSAMAEGTDTDGDLDSLDVLAALEKFPALKPTPKALVGALEPLQPRLYSISSSPRATPGKLHLTVDIVRWRSGARLRKGVASTFLADRLAPSDRVPVYIQASHGFTLPADPATPIIMVGPGTGVAPFRSFLHERRATGASGRAWLFFGHQRRDCDFFYEDELAELTAAGTLTRLSTAFSRDQEAKVYVQDRMVEEGAELYRWLEDGAWFYVCGDAKRMAPDVDRALHQVAAVHGGMTDEAARAYIAALTAAGRYRKDVY